MRIHELNISSKHDRKRKGRGISGGQGKTAGRGTKGQKSRSGGSLRPGFEGGQNPLIQRLPKLAGFKSRRTPVQTVNLTALSRVSGKTVNNQTLHERGVIASAFQPVKVVASGQLTTAKTVQLQSASTRAKLLIEKSGGSFSGVPTPRPGKAIQPKSEKS